MLTHSVNRVHLLFVVIITVTNHYNKCTHSSVDQHQDACKQFYMTTLSQSELTNLVLKEKPYEILQWLIPYQCQIIWTIPLASQQSCKKHSPIDESIKCSTYLSFLKLKFLHFGNQHFILPFSTTSLVSYYKTILDLIVQFWEQTWNLEHIT